jgi:YD repeat-containing protein
MASIATNAYTSTGLLHQGTVQMDGSRDQVTDTEFDGAGRAVKVTLPEVANWSSGSAVSARPVTSTEYDQAGNVVKTTNPLDQVWEYAYDARGRKIQEIAPAVANAHGNLEHLLTDWYYDAVGNVTSVIDPLGNTA